MNGFVWTKNHIFYYRNYREIWHSEEANPLHEIRASLEHTKKFKEHRIVEWTYFIVWFIRFINFMFLLFTGYQLKDTKDA